MSNLNKNSNRILKVKYSGSVKFRGKFLFWSWDKVVPINVDEVIVPLGQDYIKRFGLPGPVDLLIKVQGYKISFILDIDGTSISVFQKDIQFSNFKPTKFSIDRNGLKLDVWLEFL